MKVRLSKKNMLYCHPVFVIGSYDINDKPNIMAVSWGGICCSEPPCVTISLRKATYTYHNIMEHKAYTVNIPSVDYMKQADYVGVYSGRDENKFETTGLTPVKSELIHAPYVKEFPVNLICRLYKTLELGLHTQFIGEILEVLADDDTLDHRNMPLMEKVNPFIYDSAQRTYYSVGSRLDKAFVKVK